MVLRIFLYVLCPCLLLCGCGGGGTPAGSTTAPSDTSLENNSALLSGAQLGNGTENNSDLSKSLTVTQSSTDFEIKQAKFSRDDTSGTIFYVALELKNVSTQILCEITLNNVQYQSVTNGAAQTLATTTQGYVLGNYGKMDNAVRHNGCLAPGQAGYFLDTFPKLNNFTFDDINAADIGRVDVVVADKLESTKILPQNFTVTPDAVGVTANVEVKNLTAFDALIYTPKCEYILLDAKGSPLIWGNFLTDPTTVDILSDDTQKMPGGIYFTGSSNKMVVYLVYSFN